MFAEVIVAILLGVATGIATGLTPGIHVNLISVLCVSISPILLTYTSAISLGAFIVSLAVTHTFLDSIPSVFLGAPDAETALGVLPGHRYLLKGHGLMAVKLTLIGSFGALLLSGVLFTFLIPFVRWGYPYLKSVIVYIIIGVVIFMFIREEEKSWALIIFLMSGLLGLLSFSLHTLKEPLLPLFSGLFGVSTLLYSINQNQLIPHQHDRSDIQLDKGITTKALLAGEFSGFITAVMPGLGASTAAVIGMQFCRKLGDHGFMILMGSINTVNFVLSLVTLLAVNKARNGAVISLTKLVPSTPSIITVLLLSSLIAGSLAVFLTLYFSRIFMQVIARVNYRNLTLGVIFLIIVVCLIFSGIPGMIILVSSTCIGFIPAIVKTSRTHAMGCLLIPVILYLL